MRAELQRAGTFVACRITECSKNTGHRPIVMCLCMCASANLFVPFYVVDILVIQQLCFQSAALGARSHSVISN